LEWAGVQQVIRFLEKQIFWLHIKGKWSLIRCFLFYFSKVAVSSYDGQIVSGFLALANSQKEKSRQPLPKSRRF
jgi:hypothetical protein